MYQIMNLPLFNSNLVYILKFYYNNCEMVLFNIMPQWMYSPDKHRHKGTQVTADY